MSEPSHRYRRLVAIHTGFWLGLIIGTWLRSWWFVLFMFLASVVILFIAASRDEPDWPGPVSLKGKRM
jgi:uncharacterized membrane protein YoaK (UPF0700 family)